MSMQFKRMADLDLSGQRVLIRVDLMCLFKMAELPMTREFVRRCQAFGWPWKKAHV